MSKRSAQDKINYYSEKIRKLEEKQSKERHRRRFRIYTDSSNSETNSDNETRDAVNDGTADLDGSPGVPSAQPDAETPTADVPSTSEIATSDPPPAEDPVPELDADFLSALGEPADEKPKYGAKIHPDLAQRWLPILRRGILKEPKEKLIKEYSIPENCKLLRAPTLNPEISAAITEAARTRDKKIEASQQQLGLGITAVNKAMSILFTGDDKQSKVEAIKILSDGCRILCDLHFMETQARIKLITPALDKSFLNITQDIERDESLFGNKLSEKIKASKTIEKQGLQIKKPVPSQKTSTTSSSHSMTTRTRYQGNWTAPSRYQQSSNRGGRGGAQKTSSAQRPTTPAPAAQAKGSSHSKQRAPPRQ